MSRSLGIPVKLLYESAGHIVTVELKNDELYRGSMVECEDNWNCQLENITYTAKVIPLGTEWAADAYYGEPARKMGLKYIPYEILPRESTLYDRYPKDDPVLRDPSSITAKGWRFTKEVYLDSQSVRLDLNRFLKRITRVYHYTVSRRNRMEKRWDWSWQLPPEAQQEMANKVKKQARGMGR